jgi:hypothetical protein
VRSSEVLLGNLAPVGPNGFGVVVARAAKQLDLKLLLNFGSPVVASRLKPEPFTGRAPCIRTGVSLLRRPEKPNWNASAQGFRNVLADERLILPTVDTATDFPRIAHGGTITSKRLTCTVTAFIRSCGGVSYPNGRHEFLYSINEKHGELRGGGRAAPTEDISTQARPYRYSRWYSRCHPSCPLDGPSPIDSWPNSRWRTDTHISGKGVYRDLMEKPFVEQ